MRFTIALTPIASVAGSMRRVIDRDPRPPDWDDDVRRGLELVEGRAGALRRFMAAYARLARLPPPDLKQVELAGLVVRVAALESRMHVEVERGPDVIVQGDADQLEQLLINLLANAVDAALQTRRRPSMRMCRSVRAVGFMKNEGSMYN